MILEKNLRGFGGWMRFIEFNGEPDSPRRNMKRITNRCLVCCGIVAGVLAIGVAPLRADFLNPANYTLDCDNTYTLTEGTASCNGGSVGGFDTPYTEATANFVGNGTRVSGSSEVVYYVDVEGGNAGDLVPLDVDAYLYTDASGATGSDVINSLASIHLDFGSGSYSLLKSVSCGNVLRIPNSCNTPVWSGTLQETAVDASYNEIILVASADVDVNGYSDALADPHVYIDPTFAAANPEYSVTLNVSNDMPSQAPEPSTWLLGLAGTGVVALVRRKVKA